MTEINGELKDGTKEVVDRTADKLGVDKTIILPLGNVIVSEELRRKLKKKEQELEQERIEREKKEHELEKKEQELEQERIERVKKEQEIEQLRREIAEYRKLKNLIKESMK